MRIGCNRTLFLHQTTSFDVNIEKKDIGIIKTLLSHVSMYWNPIVCTCIFRVAKQAFTSPITHNKNAILDSIIPALLSSVYARNHHHIIKRHLADYPVKGSF